MKIGDLFDTILILDFGSQYSHLIVRRIRELGVYCELQPCTVKLSDVKFVPKGIILSGGPSSVYDSEAPHADPAIWQAGVPILGICYGLQEMVWSKKEEGGHVTACDKHEYGKAELEFKKTESELFDGIEQFTTIWMSHGDQVDSLPRGFRTTAHTRTAPHACIEHAEKRLYGIQFHPEVTHTREGKRLLGNFVLKICECEAKWRMENFVDKEVESLRALLPEKSHVLGAVSGGVDSTVAAVILSMAIGERFHPIFVDNGLLRKGEVEEVEKMFKDDLKIKLTVANAADEFISLLSGVVEPERKRKIIGNHFIRVFEREAERIMKSLNSSSSGHEVDYLLQGTLYPDVIESISFKGPSATIKTHHNVGGLLENMKLKLVEPFRELFKDEVRALGKLLHISPILLGRHPFPGPGLAIRILGEVTRTQIEIERAADFIFLEELRAAGLYDSMAQAFTVLLPVKSVGVMGDSRTYEQVICIRAVESTDFMTADWAHLPDSLMRKVSSRIINEVNGVNRVVHDISSKPPSTIEWE